MRAFATNFPNMRDKKRINCCYIKKKHERREIKMKNDNTLIIIVTVILAQFLFNGFGMMGFGGYGMGGMMNWMYGTGFGFMWIFGMIIWIFIVIALVLFIMWLIRQLQTPRRKR